MSFSTRASRYMLLHVQTCQYYDIATEDSISPTRSCPSRWPTLCFRNASSKIKRCEKLSSSIASKTLADQLPARLTTVGATSIMPATNPKVELGGMPAP